MTDISCVSIAELFKHACCVHMFARLHCPRRCWVYDFYGFLGRYNAIFLVAGVEKMMYYVIVSILLLLLLLLLLLFNFYYLLFFFLIIIIYEMGFSKHSSFDQGGL